MRRRLHVVFPDYVKRHTREQISCFGPDGLLRRHDFTVDVLGGAAGLNYASDYRNVDGIIIATTRRVYPWDGDYQPLPNRSSSQSTWTPSRPPNRVRTAGNAPYSPQKATIATMTPSPAWTKKTQHVLGRNMSYVELGEGHPIVFLHGKSDFIVACHVTY